MFQGKQRLLDNFFEKKVRLKLCLKSYVQRDSGHIAYVKVGGVLFEIYNSRSLFDNTCLHADMQILLRRVFMKIQIN